METIKLNWEKNLSQIDLNPMLDSIQQNDFQETPIDWFKDLDQSKQLQSEDIIYNTKTGKFGYFNKYALKLNKAYIQYFKKNNILSLNKELIVDIDDLLTVERNNIIDSRFYIENNIYKKEGD